MRPNFLLFTVLLNFAFWGSNSAYAGSLDEDFSADELYYEYMKLGRATFDKCVYDSVSIYTDCAEAYTDSEVLKQKARQLGADAITCKNNRKAGVDYMTRALYSQAFDCFASVIKLNPKDNFCRNEYSKSYIFQHKTIEACDMIALPGGSVVMGRNDGAFNEGPAHKETVNPFAISAYEITVAQYCVFLNAKGNQSKYGCDCVDLSSPYCHVTTDGGIYVPEKGYDNYPMTCVSFFGAEEFCEWLGFQLMTEVQFEYAFANSVKADSPDGPIPSKAGVANKYGIHNLNGNVAEWTRDWYNPARYKKQSGAGVSVFETVTVRGGSFNSPKDINPKTFRDNNAADSFLYNVGFRCVYEY